jgi:hypothetical protein
MLEHLALPGWQTWSCMFMRPARTLDGWAWMPEHVAFEHDYVHAARVHGCLRHYHAVTESPRLTKSQSQFRLAVGSSAALAT